MNVMSYEMSGECVEELVATIAEEKKKRDKSQLV